MRKTGASLLFSLAVIGLYMIQIDFASSFDFRRFHPSGSTNTSPSPSPTPTFSSPSSGQATDPGVRAGASAGDPLPGLSAGQLEYFNTRKTEVTTAEDVPDGLGPRMNLDSCGGCHAQPAAGGTSPVVNPQIAFATLDGGTDTVPSFLRA